MSDVDPSPAESVPDAGAAPDSLPRLPGPELRRLKAAAQKLNATFKVGKAGLSPQFLQGVHDALRHHELLKVRFDEFKEERKTLAPLLARKTYSHLIMQVGNVAVLYRRKATVEPAAAGAPA